MFQRLKAPPVSRVFISPSELTQLYEADCIKWLADQPRNTFEAVVTDPPYGMLEYTPDQMTKLRNGRGGVWRIPPSLGGHKRMPVPRFTVLDNDQVASLYHSFREFGEVLLPRLVPGAHVFVATNPLLSYTVSQAFVDSGFEKRGEIVRLTQTLRGGDRPKNAEDEFREVTVMPRSGWEPWLLFRKRCEGTVAENLRRWKTGGLRRPESGPFMDVIVSRPTRPDERRLAPHPSLKPQAFLRQIVRAALPLGQGVILDPFAGSGSTLAACEALGYRGMGIELDPHYFTMAMEAIPLLSELSPEWSSASASAAVSRPGRGRQGSPRASSRRNV